MEIRELESSECAAAVALWESAGLTRAWNPPALDFERALATNGSAVLGAVDDRGVAATAMVGFDGHRGWVYYLAVDDRLKDSGLGRQMMAAAETWLRALGATKVQLMVRRTNAAAMGFYEHLGYDDAEVVVLARWLEGGPEADTPGRFG